MKLKMDTCTAEGNWPLGILGGPDGLSRRVLFVENQRFALNHANTGLIWIMR